MFGAYPWLNSATVSHLSVSHRSSRSQTRRYGHSARPAKRLKHQLGIDKGINTAVLRVGNLATRHDARTEEESAHRTLAAPFPDEVVAKAEYGDALNITREINRPDAAPFIHRLLEEIEARLPDIGDLFPDIAA